MLGRQGGARFDSDAGGRRLILEFVGKLIVVAPPAVVEKRTRRGQELEGGGRLGAEGTPEQVAASKASYTGRYLKPALAEPRRRAAA